mgnify:CR=1 FL=1
MTNSPKFNSNDISKADNILNNMKFNKESFYTWENIDWFASVEANELLSNFWKWNYTPDVLNLLQKTDKTFDLAKKMLSFAFDEIKNKKSSSSVNLYLKDINHPEFIPFLEDNEELIENWMLILEILEYDYWVLDNQAVEKLKLLKSKWCKFAIDDFSLDYNEKDLSFENLSLMLENNIIWEWDYVKIDWAYLQKIFNDVIDRDQIRYLRSLIKFLKSKWIKVIWEWIWNTNEWYTAKSLGIDLFQWRNLDNSFELKNSEPIKSFTLNNKAESFKLIDWIDIGLIRDIVVWKFSKENPIANNINMIMERSI